MSIILRQSVPGKFRSAEYTGMSRIQNLEINMDNQVLCAASAYDKKFYLDEAFDRLPGHIKDELKIMAVLFTEDVGGIFIMEFDEDGTLILKTEADEGDLLYDEIGAALKIRSLQRDKEELFRSLEMYYKVFILGEKIQESET